ncbi:MAG TPA: trehalose-6-phosphate synthase [Terriglobales bacterium]|nr:trehalose-6-phosphate synthase [Terriglobales bacterium]
MKRLIVVSNRLPVTIERVADRCQVRSSSGGLVSALRPVLERLHGCWIGSADKSDADTLLHLAARSQGFDLSPVFLPKALRHDLYAGFCNEILWPLFHDLQSRCNFEPRYWRHYQDANAHFSKAVSSRARQDDIIWVHDYHLMLQGRLLSQRFDRRNLLYFHHVPFPPEDVFEKLPWKRDILDGLLGFGLLGFQSFRDRYNFVRCVQRVFPDVSLRKTGHKLVLVRDFKETTIGTFPIGIDFEDFKRIGMDPTVVHETQKIRRTVKGCRIILGVDRLDYTKGILERIKGFSVLLERYAGLHRRVALIQIAVPSREGVREYSHLKNQVESLIASVNDRFGQPNWAPIKYLNRHLSRSELVAFYRAADIALITPIKDGMNLVCKEFCASRVDERGVLILSEFAGAAHQLKTGALLVNPYDAEGVAADIYRALEMDERDVSRRMRRMRKIVQCQDVFYWCEDILNSINGSSALTRTSPCSITGPLPREVPDSPTLPAKPIVQANGL